MELPVSSDAFHWRVGLGLPKRIRAWVECQEGEEGQQTFFLPVPPMGETVTEEDE